MAKKAGIGLPIPSDLPADWRSQWCPQLKPRGEWAGHPDAVKAGFNWGQSCPRNGWSGWFAEFYPRTVDALRAAWETNMWGTKSEYDGQYTIREFEYAEVFWTKDHPAYKLAEGYPWNFSGEEKPPAPVEEIKPGLHAQVRVNDKWVNDTVKRRSGQVVTFETSKERYRVVDEGSTWRRADGTIVPTPVPPIEPQPSPIPQPIPDPTPVNFNLSENARKTLDEIVSWINKDRVNQKNRAKELVNEIKSQLPK